MIYVLYGDDDYTRDQQVARLKARLGDPATASMNITVLDGDRLTVGALQESCDAMPFLAERRLVIVRNFLSRYEPRKDAVADSGDVARPRRDKDLEEAVKAYLPNVPESAGLIFLEERFSEQNPFWAAINSTKKFVKCYAAPRGADLQAWIRQRVTESGGQIMPAAANLLATFVGENLRQLDLEIDKLLSYTGGKRAIQEEDVQALVTQVKEATIFQVVDAIATHGGKRAIGLFHTLLDEGTSPIYVLAMITRQFRIILQVKEMVAAGATQGEMQSRLHLHAYVVSKAADQARNFTLQRLEAIYRRLAEVDAGIKRGRMEPELALDLLVVELAGIT